MVRYRENEGWHANQLEDQFCFRTEQAVACLDFQEARKYVV